jgi:hypothetical protein
VPIEFKTEVQKGIYDRIGQYVRELFGEYAQARTDFPSYFLTMGSALVQVLVLPWGDDDAAVNVKSYVVAGAERTPEMLEFLLRENNDLRFGAFGLDKDGDVIFEHTIVGSSCDKHELKASILAVVGTADNYDDKIVSRWGGKRALDRS